MLKAQPQQVVSPPLIFSWRPTPKISGLPAVNYPDLLSAGIALIKGGVNVIPIDAKKTPADPPLPSQRWKKYQKERVTEALLWKWAKTLRVHGWAMIGGKVSGGLVDLDFDAPGFFERFMEKVKRNPEVRELAYLLPIQQTGSGNHQMAFRCSLSLKSDKLAWIPADNKQKKEAAIETKAEGGYAVVAPSHCPKAEKHGKKHKQAYRVIQGDFGNIPTITDRQATIFLDLARSLDEMPPTEEEMKAAPLPPNRNGNGGEGVIDVFNRTLDIRSILERNRYERRGNRHLSPDSTSGLPGVYIFGDTGRCYSHHGNDPLSDGHSHDPFSAFCILEHGGDVKAAVKAAAAELGFERTPSPKKPDPQQEAPMSPPEKPQDKKPVLRPITAKDLCAKTFAPPRWAVPDLLPEGLIILAGKPKAGKSWLALNLAVAVATGGVALGKIQVEAGEVLYLALEDSEPRLKGRIEKIMPFGDLPETLHLLTARDFPPLQKGGLEALDTWLTEHPQARLVIIDTLARVKPQRGKNQDSYDADTAIISDLQTISIKHRLALIVVHHTKKLATDDFVESVSGTFGLTGAADCIAVLIRKGRMAADALFKITGRDVPDIEKALKFHSDLGAWKILGEAQEYASSQDRQDILLILKETGPKTPAQLSKIIDKSSGAVRITLMRMKDKGEVILNQDGSYSV